MRSSTSNKNSTASSGRKGIFLDRAAKRKIALAALVLVTIILVFATLEPVFFPFSSNQKYSELGIYGPNETLGDYPTSVAANQSFTLYAYLVNQKSSVQFYNVLVKLGNQSTQISNSTYANAPIISEYYHSLNVNQTYVFPMSLSISQTGIQQRLIFELWSYHLSKTGWGLNYTGVWDQIWLNVTAA